MERVEKETEEEHRPGGTPSRVGAVVWSLARPAVGGGAGTDAGAADDEVGPSAASKSGPGLAAPRQSPRDTAEAATPT